MGDDVSAGPDIATQVFARLMRQVYVGDVLRWDLASPYLRRHATEHAEECGNLHLLFRDLEFLVHADPRSVLSAGGLPQALASARLMLAYQTSLARHSGAAPEARRHILAVDAMRYGGSVVSERLYHPPHCAPAPWQCRWSTAQNISSSLIRTLARTSEPVHSAAIGALDDRDYAVTAGDDHTAHVWDLASGTLLHELRGHSGPLTALAVGGTPPTHAVTADAQGNLRWWDAPTGKLLGEIAGAHAGAVTGLRLAMVDDAPVAVTCGADRAIRSWELRTGRLRHLLTEAPSPAVPMAVVPGWDGELLVVIGDDSGRTIAVDLTTGEEVNRLSADTEPVVAVAALDDGANPAVVLATGNGQCQVWEVADPEPTLAWSWGHGAVSSLCVIDAGEETVAVVAGAAGVIEVRAVNDGQLLHTFEGHSGRVTALASCFSGPEAKTASEPLDLLQGRKPVRPPDRRSQSLAALSRCVLLSASEDRTLRVWNLGDGRLLSTLSAHRAAVRAIAVSSRDEHVPTVVSCGDDATARIWQLPLRHRIAETARGPQRIEALAAARAGGRILIATVCDDHLLRVFDATSGKVERTYTVGRHAVTALGIGAIADGPVVVAATADGGLAARRAASGQVLWRLPESQNSVTALAVGGSARRPVVVVLRADGQVLVHELGSGTSQTGGPSPDPGATAIATGRIREKPIAVIGHRDGRIDVWNLTSGQLRRSLRAGVAELTGVAFGTSGPGDLIVSRHTDDTIRVWDADTGHPTARIGSSGASMLAVGTAPGQPVVVEMDADGAVQFWDAETGEPRANVWLPERAVAFAMVEGVVAVGYGRELAVLSASDDPGPWQDDTPEPKPTPRRAERPARAPRTDRVSHLDLAVLAALQRRGAQDRAELREALRAHWSLKAVKAALGGLERRGLVHQLAGSDRYQLSEAGRARLPVRARPPFGSVPQREGPAG
jgi:WD40 repeat protein